MLTGWLKFGNLLTFSLQGILANQSIKNNTVIIMQSNIYSLHWKLLIFWIFITARYRNLCLAKIQTSWFKTKKNDGQQMMEM